jgi:glycogenin glucosyltransferase
MVDPAAFNHSVLSNPVSHNPEEHAVVSAMYTDNYILPITTLGYTVQVHNISARRILMYLPERISNKSLCLAQAAGWELFPVHFIAPPKNGKDTLTHYRDQYTKLNLWTLDTFGIKSLVYLDADTIVRKNFDELFTLPYTFGATPDIWLDHRGFTVGFNAGVLLLRPDTRVFKDMVSKLETADYSLAFAEQAFLNVYFGAQALRLPLAYNGNIAIKYKSRALWDALQDDLRVVHYTLAKPFPGKRPLQKGQTRESFLEESLKTWGGIWKEELLW